MSASCDVALAAEHVETLRTIELGRAMKVPDDEGGRDY
jgi:hypothetical protein